MLQVLGKQRHMTITRKYQTKKSKNIKIKKMISGISDKDKSRSIVFQVASYSSLYGETHILL